MSGMSLHGFNSGRYAFTLKKYTWANSTQVEFGFILGSFYCSVNRAYVTRADPELGLEKAIIVVFLCGKLLKTIVCYMKYCRLGLSHGPVAPLVPPVNVNRVA